MSDPLRGISLFHPPGHLERPMNPFGKDIANAELFRALVEHGDFREVAVLNQAGVTSDQLSEQMVASPATQFVSGTLLNTAYPALHGTLLRGQPYLSELAWLRRTAGLDKAYSLVGLIHTIAPPFVRKKIGAAAIAPTHEWDALVCTSPAVQKAMESMFDEWAEHLHARIGAIRSPRPQLPLIPLAVDTELFARQADNHKARAALRQRLAILEDDILVLWVGRLSYYEKAFPQSMFNSIRIAAESCSNRLHFALVGWFPGGDEELRLYQKAAEELAPDINVSVLDGNDEQLLAQSWAAGDIFLSLVDNIQETFGLTPIEAMAAGLPIVASDWNGYPYTIRDGVNGFLVPTLSSPGGALGELLANLHSLELETYQTYVGATAQHTAVNVQVAASAIALLANDKALRKKMGDSGRERAKSMFSWPEVIRLYKDLLSELGTRRNASETNSTRSLTRLHPLSGEPFSNFRHFSSAILNSDHLLRLAQNKTSTDLNNELKIQLNTLYPGIRGTSQEAFQMLAIIERQGKQGARVQDILAEFTQERRPFLESTLVWLAKMGLIDWTTSRP